MPQRLSDIGPDELSLVNRGANRRPFLFAKADEEISIDPQLGAVLEAASEGEEQLFKALQDAGVDVEPGKAAIAAFRLLKAHAEQLPQEMQAVVASLEGKEFTPAPAPEPEPTPIEKKEDPVPENGVPFKKDDGSWDLSSVPEEQRAALEVILKAHDGEVAELRKSRDELKTQADEATEIAKAEKDKRESAEYVAKAEQLDKLPIAPDEFGPLLKEIAGSVDPETFAKLEGVLTSANEAVSQGALFQELGAGGDGGKSDAETRIEKAAEKIREAQPELSPQQAFTKALEQNPDLYAAYRQEA